MSVDIAKLVARLELQTAQFQAELEKSNRKLSKFDSDARRTFGKIAGAFKFALAGISVGAAFSKLVTETSAAESALANLENAVRNNAGAAGFTTPQLTEMASELQRLTTYSDDAVMGMQALLLRFRGISGPIFERAQRAILDLATGLGVDLTSATRLVGRALADPEKGIKALSRAGVVLSASQRKTIEDLAETGQRAKASGILLSELEARFGGAAEAARNTFGGALAGLQNTIGDLFEQKEGLPGIIGAINEISSTLSDSKTKEAVDSFGALVLETTASIAKAFAALLGPVLRFIQLFGDIGAFIDNQLFDRRLSESEFRRIFQQSARGTGPKRRRTPAPPPGAPPPGDDDPEVSKEQLNALDALEKLRDGLEQQIATYEQGAAATIEYRIAHGDLAEQFKKAGAAARPLKAELIALTKELETKQARTEVKGMIDAVREQIATYGMGETAVLRYRLAHGELGKTFAKTGEDAEKSRRALIDFTQQLEALKRAESAITDFAAQTSDSLTASLESFSTDFESRYLKSIDTLTVFQEQAARNTQDILANTLINGFDGGVKGILRSFGDMLRQMIAQAVAADLAGRIFGEKGGGAKGSTGWLGMLAGFFGLGTKASGGPVAAGHPYLIGEHGPEVMVPSRSGTIVPNDRLGGQVNHISVTVQTPTGRVPMETQQQVANRVAGALATARRRNG